MKGFKPNAKMSHSGDMGGDGRTHRKIEKVKGYAVGGIASGGPAPTPIKRPGAPSANLGSGGGSRPSINPALIENKPPPGGGGSGGRIIAGFKNGIDPSGRGVYDAAPPNRRNPPALGQLPLDGSGGRRNPPALGLGKLQPVPLKPSPRELYLGGSKDFDESTGTYRGRPGGGMAFKKGGSIKGESEMKKSDSKMKVMKKAIGGGISGGPTRVGPKPMPSNPLNRGSISNLPTRVGPKPMPSNPLNRGPISRMKKGGSAKGRKGMK